MNLDRHSAFQHPLKRIGVIGAGISGLGAAYVLSQTHQVTLFEAEKRLGGHARTVIAGKEEQYPVDTGFIVFNYRNYPNLTALFEKLDVPVIKSDMSFAASINNGEIEYGLQTLKALFADLRNVARPMFWQMIRDIFRFNAKALDAANDLNLTLGQLLDQLNMGRWFRQNFLLPISGAIWSTPPQAMLDFPAKTFTNFFHNHGLLSINDQPQWWTVEGGSQEYVKRIEQAMVGQGTHVRMNAAVISVTRSGEKILVKTKNNEAETFDAVVFACHSDQALKLLSDPTQEEQDILSALRYETNHVYLHNDQTHMPKRRACWSSWVYRTTYENNHPKISVTYWMNRLQSIPETTPLFVTLNPIDIIKEDAIFDQTVFHHPQFDYNAIIAQEKLEKIQGKNATYYCGAYTRYGFHEDGLLSALNVAKALGCKSPLTL